MALKFASMIAASTAACPSVETMGSVFPTPEPGINAAIMDRTFVGAVTSLNASRYGAVGNDVSLRNTQNCGSGSQSAFWCCSGVAGSGCAGRVLVLGVDDDAGGAMIERLHHLAFVERHPVTGRAAEAVTANRICAFSLL